MRHDQRTLFVTEELLRDSESAGRMVEELLRNPDARYGRKPETYGYDREPVWYDEHDEPIEPLRVIVTPEGNIKFLWDDDLAPLFAIGAGLIGRASHVEPLGTLWIVDLEPVGGPRLGPFRWRSEALRAERVWLETNPESPVCITEKP